MSKQCLHIGGITLIVSILSLLANHHLELLDTYADIPLSKRLMIHSYLGRNISLFKEIRANLQPTMLAAGIWDFPSTKKYDANLTESQLLNYMLERQVLCDRRLRLGRLGDGGWDVCINGGLKPKNDCLVYSFGINYDFSFDDAMANTFNCTVYSFDPSLKLMPKRYLRGKRVHFIPEGLSGTKHVSKQNWSLNTLEAYIKEFGHSERTIDYLKIDIDDGEWDSMPQITESGIMAKVKQFGLEFHRHGMSRQDVRNPITSKTYELLKSIEDQGFRKWLFHFNAAAGSGYRTEFGKDFAKCAEIYYLNTKFIKSDVH